ncbi:LysE family transporter [bacterium SCSIO 12643]|nr:LysE family transporter [bacterium SCSIO 12643]
MDFAQLSIIISVLGIHLLAVMSPGPDFFMAVRNSLTYSRKTGIYTAIGFGLGIGVHVGYSIFGLGYIISQSIWIYNIIKYMGAAYLVWIGIQSFLSKDGTLDVGETSKKEDISPLKAIRIGFLTNVLNPKATLFFLSLFTIVIGPETPKSIMLFTGVMMMVNTALWFSFLSYLITHSKVLPFFEKYQNIFNKLFGGILVAIGVKVAFFTD